MNDTQTEATKARGRLHWGIFILPLLTTAMMLLVAVPLLFLVHIFTKMMTQLNPQHVVPVHHLLYVIPFFPAIIVGLPLLLVTWATYLKSEVTLTNRRLIFRTGFVRKTAGEIPLENVEAITIVEPLLGRVLGYGTVIVTSVGGLQFPLRYIRSPRSFHAILQKAVNDAKRPVLMNKASGPLPDDDSRYMPKV